MLVAGGTVFMVRRKKSAATGEKPKNNYIERASKFTYENKIIFDAY